MVFQAILRLVGITRLEEDLDAVRAEQKRIARELDLIKRSNLVGVEVEVERLRAVRREPEPEPGEDQ